MKRDIILLYPLVLKLVKTSLKSYYQDSLGLRSQNVSMLKTSGEVKIVIKPGQKNNL